MKPSFEVLKLLQLRVHGIPCAQTRPRMSKGVVYSNASKGLKIWKGILKRELSAARDTMEIRAVDGALCVDMVFLLPSSDRNRWGCLAHTKPDKDNLEKAVLDVMEDVGLFVVGDSQVAAGEVLKMWCPAEDAGLLLEFSRIRTKKNPAQGGAVPDWLS